MEKGTVTLFMPELSYCRRTFNPLTFSEIKESERGCMSVIQDEIKRLLSEQKIVCGDKGYEQLCLYAELLKASPRKSFASWDSDISGIEMHFKDSFYTLPETPSGSFADIGSGAGVPGVIYAILWPETKGVLLDSQVRRCDFLRSILTALKMDDRISVVCERAETAAHEAKHRESYSLVTARALAVFPAFLEYTSAFVKPGGFLQAIRGNKDRNILQEFETVIQKMGLKSLSQKEYVLKPGDSPRWVWMFQKERNLSKLYPRKNQEIGQF